MPLFRGVWLFGAVQQLVEIQFQLGISIITPELAEQQAGLNVAAILVFVAAVLVTLTDQLQVVDLADLHAWIDSDRLHAVHLQGPRPAVADVADAATWVDE